MGGLWAALFVSSGSIRLGYWRSNFGSSGCHPKSFKMR